MTTRKPRTVETMTVIFWRSTNDVLALKHDERGATFGEIVPHYHKAAADPGHTPRAAAHEIAEERRK